MTPSSFREWNIYVIAVTVFLSMVFDSNDSLRVGAKLITEGSSCNEVYSIVGKIQPFPYWPFNKLKKS